MNDNPEVELAILKHELENVSKEISGVKEHLVEISSKQNEIINNNSEEVRALYQKMSELDTKYEVLKHRIETCEKNLGNLHVSNRNLMVQQEVLQAKLDDISRRTDEDHVTIENLRTAKEAEHENGSNNRMNFIYTILSGVIVAAVTLIITMVIG